MTHAWVAALEPGAPDVVAAWRGIDEGRFISVRREVRRRSGEGTAMRTIAQLGATAAALRAVVEALPDEAFALPGGEADWNVAEAVGHVASARSGLVLAASLAAGDRWPADAPTVVPGIPGPRAAGRETLVRKIDQSQRVVERTGRAVSGLELVACPLEHPLVGRLRCGEWLLFAGVHDLMHLEQLHRIADAATGRS
jgi:DinB family protein